jgi:hypothetical protein
MIMKPLWNLLAGVLVTPALSLSVSAQEIPRFDVNTHCRQVAGVGGTYSEALFGSCMDMEQSAYDGLKTEWAALPTAARYHCIQVATVAGPGSYSLLQSCIQMETEAASQNRQRNFRY